jgi:hypothetical protein
MVKIYVFQLKLQQHKHFSQNSPISNYMKILPAILELFHAMRPNELTDLPHILFLGAFGNLPIAYEVRGI